MRGSIRRKLFAVVRRALRQPLSLAVIVAGGIWSLATSSGIPFVIALVLALAYAVVKLQDDEFVRTAIQEASGRQREADLLARTFRVEELDVDSRIRLKAIIKLQSEIEEDVANSPVDEVAVGLADTVEQTAALIERGLAMAQKRRELLRYLNRTEPSAIENRIASLESKLESESDEARRSEIEASLSSKRQEIEDYQAIHKASQRVLEQLDSIQVAFEALRARLVRIKSSDIADWVAANQELKTELGHVVTAADVVEKSIEEALSVGGTNA